MGLITKEVEVTITPKNINHYKEKGYDTEIWHKIIVKTKDLSEGSHTVVECDCDYCGKPLKRQYKTYIRDMNGIIPKVCCKECLKYKIKESNQKVYGVSSVTQLPDVIDKIKETNLIKYGHENYTQTSEYHERHIATCLQKYGVEHISQSEEIKKKKAKTTMDHYGVENPFMSEEIKNKSIQTSLEKYGTEYPMQSNDVKEKFQNTMMSKYGVSNPSQVVEFAEKRKATMIKNYGVENPQQSKEIQEKTKNTNIIKYGYDNPSQNPEVKEKIRETNIKRYGVPDPMQSPVIQAKAIATMAANNNIRTSTQQKYLCDLYEGELNFPIKQYSVDVLLENENIVLEYDGGGHFLSVELGTKTQEEYEQREIVRDKLIKKEGYKIFRIISNTDKLPSDEVLLQMLELTKQYFADYPEHSWREWYLDEGIYRDAEHKDGEPFDFGTLRKIKTVA